MQRKENDYQILTESCEEVLNTCDKFPDDTKDDDKVQVENDKISKRWSQLNETLENLLENSDDTKKAFYRYEDHISQANITLNQITEALEYTPLVGVNVEESERQLARVEVRCIPLFIMNYLCVLSRLRSGFFQADT